VADTLTIINETRATDVVATVIGDRVLLAPDAVETAIGWALKPEGFCRGDVCVPVRENPAAVVDGNVDLAAFAELIGRPLALDLAERAAAMAAAPADRGAMLTTLLAPEFTLPDLEGRMHSLSAHRGKKVFLAVWASW
jgi:hypothetical protein